MSCPKATGADQQITQRSPLVFTFHTYVHDLLEEVLELGACLFVDGARDALDTAAARKSADVRLGDAVDVVPQDFSIKGQYSSQLVWFARECYSPVALRTADLAQGKAFSSDATPAYTSD